METHERDQRVGLGKTRNGTSEQVSGSCTLSSLHKLVSSPVLCDALTFVPVPFTPFQLRALKKLALEKQTPLPAFWHQFYSASIGHSRQPKFPHKSDRGRAGKAALSYPASFCAWQHRSPQPCRCSQPCSASPCRWRLPSLHLHRHCPQRRS